MERSKLLDDILNSAENEELVKTSAEEIPNEKPESGIKSPGGLGDLEKMSTIESKETFIARLSAMTDDLLSKTASDENEDMLMKVAEETLADIESLAESARMLGKIAADEFFKTLEAK